MSAQTNLLQNTLVARVEVLTAAKQGGQPALSAMSMGLCVFALPQEQILSRWCAGGLSATRRHPGFREVHSSSRGSSAAAGGPGASARAGVQLVRGPQDPGRDGADGQGEVQGRPPGHHRRRLDGTAHP